MSQQKFSEPNNFAKKMPTVVLYVPDDDMEQAQALVGEDGEPLVFKNFSKAAKHVSRFIDPKMHPFIKYVNDKPEIGSGDREETNNKRCLKCNSFLRPSHVEQSINQTMTVETYDCPVCDLGESK